MSISRRLFLLNGSMSAGTAWLATAHRSFAQSSDGTKANHASQFDPFPQQDPKLVEQVVGASHGRFDQVKQLIGVYPELAKCS